MKSLSTIFQSTSPVVSIEIFPPKTDKGDESLFSALDCLTQHQPAFISCTYGAGGTTSKRTLDLCEQIHQRYQVPATAHFTCVGATREELLNWLTEATSRGVQNIMALRGDAPKGETEFKAVEGGLSHANELVELIRSHFPEMGIGVAAYPEKHQEAADLKTDLENLKRKIDAGADAAFTQLFFKNENFFAFRDLYEQAGCRIPLVAGIMPATEYAKIKRIVSLSGTDFPQELADKLEAAQGNEQAELEVGVEFATRQCQELLAQGVSGLHFYALNKSDACQKILNNLSLNQPS